MRIEQTAVLTAFGRPLIGFEQYAASEPALLRERELVAFDEYVRMLRQLRISFGDDEAAIPEYRVALSPGVAATVRSWGVRQSWVLYALTYDPIEPGPEASLPADAKALLSEQLLGLEVRFLPNRDKRA
jgi:hypothetical protein